MAVATPTGVTGWSGFWNYGPLGAPTGGYGMRFGRTSQEARIAMNLARPGMRRLRAIMRTLNGVAPGATAPADTHRRIKAPVIADDLSFSGNRTMETIDYGSVTTTAGHVTALNANIYDKYTGTQFYPVDRSGNGGGGKRAR
jgi:hypothetical protein